MTDKDFLKQAIILSEESVNVGGFPVGALVVQNGKIIATGFSDGKRLLDATSHAEICAIREASKELATRDLNEVTIYSSMEPCLMCFAAAYWAKASRIVYACSKQKLSRWHYEGLHNLGELNKRNNRQMEIVHYKDLENEALTVITKWEAIK